MGERKGGTGEGGWIFFGCGVRAREGVRGQRERGKETRGVAEWGEAVGSVGGSSLGRGVVAAQRSTYRRTHLFVVPSFLSSFRHWAIIPSVFPSFLPSFFLSFLSFPRKGSRGRDSQLYNTGVGFVFAQQYIHHKRGEDLRSGGVGGP
jgi:hypothetical protein